MFKIKNIVLFLMITLTPVAGNGKTSGPALKDLSGSDHLISQYIGQGQWTVVVIWAEDCEICNAEIEALDVFHQQHKDKDAVVLGVSIDGQERINLARDFVKRHNLTFTNLVIEPEMDELLKFGGGNFIGTPTFYIYLPDGKIVASQAGAVAVDTIEQFINSWEKP